MIRSLTLVLATAALLLGLNAQACERHVHGHQGSSDTNTEASQN